MKYLDILDFPGEAEWRGQYLELLREMRRFVTQDQIEEFRASREARERPETWRNNSIVAYNEAFGILVKDKTIRMAEGGLVVQESGRRHAGLARHLALDVIATRRPFVCRVCRRPSRYGNSLVTPFTRMVGEDETPYVHYPLDPTCGRHALRLGALEDASKETAP